jgi:hypothetical protein
MPIINKDPIYQCDFCATEFEPETFSKLHQVNSIVIGMINKSYLADCICERCSQTIIEAVRKINTNSMTYMAGMREV